MDADARPVLPARAVPAGSPAFPLVGGASLVPPQPPLKRRLGYELLRLVNRLMPKIANRVVLHSTIDLEDGVLAVLEGLAERGWTATVLLEDPQRAALLREMAPAGVRTLPKRSRRALLRFLTARYAMTTENLFGNLTPPRSQIVVNLWHGEPSAKVTARFFAGQGGLRCTYAPVCSTVGRAYRSAEFGVHPLRVPIVGAPRNDRMLRSDGPAVRRSLLGVDADRPTLLWLPSFRAGRWDDRLRVDSAAEHHPGLPYSADDVRRIDSALDEMGARMVVKLHPHDAESFSGDYRAIRSLTQQQMHAAGLTLYPMLPAFDGLVTDMSSIWMDYLLLDRPMVFAFPDIEGYRAGRGINMEPYEDWVPGPFTRTVEELVAALRDVVEGRDPMAQERGRARRRFHAHRDAHSTVRLLDGLGIS